MKLHRTPTHPDTGEAWLARLDASDCSLEQRAAFAQWYASDPAHAEAFDEARRLHATVASLRSDPMLRAASLEARRRTARSRRRRGPLRLVLPVALAASLLLAFGVTRWRDVAAPAGQATHAERRFAGTPGGVRSIRLDDGTNVMLDVDAALSVRFDDRRRLVVLERGRAQFQVAPAAVPFEVRAAENVIRDTGTTFQVSDDNGAVTVGLLEGGVAVSRRDGAGAQTLSPAQQIHIAADGSSDGVKPLDTEAASGWARGELMFRQRPLVDLLATMNRYSEVKVRLGDTRLGTLQVSGSFHAGDQEALVKALVAGWPVRAERRDGSEFVLYPVSSGRPEHRGAHR